MHITRTGDEEGDEVMKERFLEGREGMSKLKSEGIIQHKLYKKKKKSG